MDFIVSCDLIARFIVGSGTFSPSLKFCIAVKLLVTVVGIGAEKPVDYVARPALCQSRDLTFGSLFVSLCSQPFSPKTARLSCQKIRNELSHASSSGAQPCSGR